MDTQVFWETSSIPSPSAIFCKTQSTRGGTAAIRHNPWIIGRKKTAFLDESEWVTYPDPNIPAIVSEELWNQANEIFKKRSARTKAYGVGYQSKYPYSGKIICGKHGTTFHRQSFKTMEGHTEYWQCRMYREHGKSWMRFADAPNKGAGRNFGRPIPKAGEKSKADCPTCDGQRFQRSAEA